jgi:uncharacterized membrane protein
MPADIAAPGEDAARRRPAAGAGLNGEAVPRRGTGDSAHPRTFGAGFDTSGRNAPRAGVASGPRKAALLALAVGLAIAAYTVTDKIGLNHVTPAVLIEATNTGNALVLLPASLRSGHIKAEARPNIRPVLLGGALMPSGYVPFLFALSLAPVAQLAPMREIGTVFGAALGVAVLKERGGARRLTASCLITAGVIALGAAG